MKMSSLYVIGVALTALVVAPSPGVTSGILDTPVRDIGSRVELFVDDWLIEAMTGTRLKMHSPTRREIVFAFDAPWEGFQSSYVSVMKDDALYRMYYRAGGDLDREYTAMALSNDGVVWTRPNLGLYSFQGSTNNNIIWTGEKKAYDESHNFSPFKDTNPSAPPSMKYKAVTLDRYDVDGDGDASERVLSGFISADGVHWTKIQPEPLITLGGFDSHNVAFYDSVNSRYVCYSRMAVDGKRAIAFSESLDFLNWSTPIPLNYGDAPLVQFYTNGMTVYPRAPHIFIGLPMRFVPERQTVGVEQRTVDALSDAVLISSHDGLNFRRPFMEAFIRPGPNPMNWGSGHGNQTPAFGVHQTAPDEISVYWLEQYYYSGASPSPPKLRRGSLRLDGFVSVNADYVGGEMITKPLTFQGRNLFINYSTSAKGFVKVEIQNESGTPLSGFDLSASKDIYGDELDRIVSWNGVTDLSSLAGQTVRLRFSIRDADLFAIQFRD